MTSRGYARLALLGAVVTYAIAAAYMGAGPAVLVTCAFLWLAGNSSWQPRG